MKVAKECEWCGKLFLPKTGNDIYCCAECRKQGQVAKRQGRKTNESGELTKAEKKRISRTQQALTDDAIKARELGLTYGQWIAKKNKPKWRKHEVECYEHRRHD